MKGKTPYALALIVMVAAIAVYLSSRDHQKPNAPPPDQKTTHVPSPSPSNTPRLPSLDNTDQPASNLDPAQPLQFTLTNFAIDVQFEDPDLTLEERQTITADLNLVYGHLALDSVREIAPDPSGKSTHRIFLTGKGRYWPDQLDQLGAVIDDGNTRRLLIGRAISDHYKTAIEFTADHSKAIGKIATNLNNIHSLAQSDDLEATDAKTAFMVNSPTLTQLEDADFIDNLHALKGGEIRPPSILDYRMITVGESEYLAAETILLYADHGSIRHAERINVAFDGGAWKLLF